MEVGRMKRKRRRGDLVVSFGSSLCYVILGEEWREEGAYMLFDTGGN